MNSYHKTPLITNHYMPRLSPYLWIRSSSIMLLLLLITGTGLAGQELTETDYSNPVEYRDFSSDDWESLVEELDYSGEPKKEKAEREVTPPSSSGSSSSSSRRSPFSGFKGGSDIMKVILIFGLAGLLGWLLFRLMGQGETKIAPSGVSERGQRISLERIEEQLEQTDVDHFIREAEAERAYHKAVRLHFLALLKTLSETGQLQWKKDRTNRVYLNQMRESELFTDFRDLTMDYERIWYGDHHPEYDLYQLLRQRFLDLRQRAEGVNALSQ